MKPTKRHNNKKITIYNHFFNETVTGVYRHIDNGTCFEMVINDEDGERVSLFSRSDFIVIYK